MHFNHRLRKLRTNRLSECTPAAISSQQFLCRMPPSRLPHLLLASRSEPRSQRPWHSATSPVMTLPEFRTSGPGSEASLLLLQASPSSGACCTILAGIQVHNTLWCRSCLQRKAVSSLVCANAASRSAGSWLPVCQLHILVPQSHPGCCLQFARSPGFLSPLYLSTPQPCPGRPVVQN